MRATRKVTEADKELADKVVTEEQEVLEAPEVAMDPELAVLVAPEEGMDLELEVLVAPAEVTEVQVVMEELEELAPASEEVLVVTEEQEELALALEAPVDMVELEQQAALEEVMEEPEEQVVPDKEVTEEELVE